jgi:hypothetical protein
MYDDIPINKRIFCFSTVVYMPIIECELFINSPHS